MSTMHYANREQGCENCTDGFFTIEEHHAERIGTEPLTDRDVENYGRAGRARLAERFGDREHWRRVYPAHVTRKVARCACIAGQMLSKDIASVSQALSAIELGLYWPGGLPSSTRGIGEDEMKAAGVPLGCVQWTLDSFEQNPHFRKDPDAMKYHALAREWVKGGGRRADVIAFGPNGTGKTGLAIAMLHGALQQQMSARFVSVKELMLEIRDTYRKDADDSELSIMRRYIEPGVLVLDELSGVKGSEHAIDTLVLLIDRRQKFERPTIFTMNLGQDLGPQQAAAEIATFVGPTLFDRLRERASFWALFGKSKRQPNRRLVDISEYRNGERTDEA